MLNFINALTCTPLKEASFIIKLRTGPLYKSGLPGRKFKICGLQDAWLFPNTELYLEGEVKDFRKINIRLIVNRYKVHYTFPTIEANNFHPLLIRFYIRPNNRVCLAVSQDKTSYSIEVDFPITQAFTVAPNRKFISIYKPHLEWENN